MVRSRQLLVCAALALAGLTACDAAEPTTDATAPVAREATGERQEPTAPEPAAVTEAPPTGDETAPPAAERGATPPGNAPAEDPGDDPGHPTDPAAAGDAPSGHDDRDAAPAQPPAPETTEEPAPEAERHDALDAGEPAAPADLIVIAQPDAGATLPAGPVTAAGTAVVYEGTVLVELVDPDGVVVERTFTTAAVGAPDRGDWRHTFSFEATTPGTWTVRAGEIDDSGGEGRAPVTTTRSFVIS